MNLRSRVLVCVFFIFSSLSIPAFAADVEFPLVQSMASFPFDEESGTLRRGEVAATFTLSQANIFMLSHDPVTTNDMESLSGVLGLRLGVGGGVTLEVYTRWSGILGGWLDGFIENFHATFALPHNQRPFSPRDQVDYQLDDLFAYTAGTGVSGPVTLAAHLGVIRGKRFSLGARLALQASPAGVPGLVSERPALIAGMSALWKQNAFAMGLSAHMAFFKSPGWLREFSITPRVFMGEGWARFRWFRAGMIWRTSPFRSGDLAHDGWQVFLGFRLRRGVEFRIQEDLGPFDTTPDIQFGIRIRLEELAKSRDSG